MQFQYESAFNGLENHIIEVIKERLGIVEYSNTETGFCFTVPPKGVDYVHESIDENYFLRDFIEKISVHDCSLEDLMRISVFKFLPFFQMAQNSFCPDLKFQEKCVSGHWFN